MAYLAQCESGGGYLIPQDFISEWKKSAPWLETYQVEQDLIISRALVEMFSHSLVAERLAFRGGTALYKLHMARRLCRRC